MLFNFWLFVFSVHFVHSLRSNSYQNDHFKKSNSYQTALLQRRESRFKNIGNLETKKSYQNGHDDQLLAEGSNIDQFIEHNHIIPESASTSYSTPKNKPQPYAFGFESDDGWGTKQYRSEKKQGKTVTGSYGYIDKNGIYRHVQYIADKQGFRARIRTNEPGTANKNPASVIVESNPSPQTNKDDYKADNGDYKHQATELNELVKQHIEPQYSENRIRSIEIRKQQPKSPSNNGLNNYSNTFIDNNDDLTNNFHNKDELNKNFLNNQQNRDSNEPNFLNNDHHNHLNNNQNNLINSSIRHWNDESELNYPSETNIHYRNQPSQQHDQLNEQIENNSEQNDQLDDQQDDDYQINQTAKRKNLFRARL